MVIRWLSAAAVEAAAVVTLIVKCKSFNFFQFNIKQSLIRIISDIYFNNSTPNIIVYDILFIQTKVINCFIINLAL